MNSVSEKIKNECLDGMDFERILEIYNLYIDVNQREVLFNIMLGKCTLIVIQPLNVQYVVTLFLI